MWTLLLARQSDPPGTYLERRQLDGGEIKVGRSARTCDWVLADDQGHVSREHCTIMAAGLDLFVVDTSTNGTSLNAPAQRLAPQQPVAIRLRDRLLIGDYVIEIGNEAVAGLALAPAPPPPLPGGASLGQQDPWFAAAADPVWGDQKAAVHEFLGDAMHDFLGGPASAAGGGASLPWAGPLGDAAKPMLAQMSAPAAADFGIPEDWAAPPTGRAGRPVRRPPAADLFEAFARAPAGDPFEAFAKAPAGDPFADLAPGRPAADPFADFAPAPSGVDAFADAGPIFPAGDPFEAALRTAPSPAEPFASPTPPPARAASAAPPGDAWAAFCEGAGMDPAELRAAPDAMRRLGVLYRQVVLGLSDLIQDRAAFKDEFRVERTQLGFGRNNPLKHLPPLDTARVLLDAPMPGFMGSEEAVRAALEDVKRHQLAMLAGVQAALAAVFERLSPAEIEKLMAKAAGARPWAAFRRGVDPWTVYQTVFEALRVDATKNANSVMSVAFRDGYERFLKQAG